MYHDDSAPHAMRIAQQPTLLAPTRTGDATALARALLAAAEAVLRQRQRAAQSVRSCPQPQQQAA